MNVYDRFGNCKNLIIYILKYSWSVSAPSTTVSKKPSSQNHRIRPTTSACNTLNYYYSQFIIIKIITSVKLSAPQLNKTSSENETSGSDTSSDEDTLEDSVCEFSYSNKNFIK